MRPRRSSDRSMMVVVHERRGWMNSMTEAYSTAISLWACHRPGGWPSAHGRAHALCRRCSGVLANLRESLDARVAVTQERWLTRFQVLPDGLEQLR